MVNNRQFNLLSDNFLASRNKLKNIHPKYVNKLKAWLEPKRGEFEIGTMKSSILNKFHLNNKFYSELKTIRSISDKKMAPISSLNSQFYRWNMCRSLIMYCGHTEYYK